MSAARNKKSALEWHEKELEYCTYCPKLCRHACPVSNALGDETLIPQAKMQLLNMLRRNAIPWQEDYVAALYGCAGCGLCQQYCLHGTDVADALWAGRAVARERDLGHPATAQLPEVVRTRNLKLLELLEEGPFARRLAKEARVGYIPAAEPLETSTADIEDAFIVFDSLGLDFVRLVHAPIGNASYPLWAAGFTDAARFAAEEAVRCLRRFATVVVANPATAHTLRVHLPYEGFEHNTEVLHISEFLAGHAERLEIVRRRSAAYFHDPCYLGRHLGVYEAPRRLLARCVDSVREFFHNRERAECCGAGGLLPLTHNEARSAQALRRLAEVQLFEVPLVVTSCPTCRRTLANADADVEVLDLVNVIAWALRPSDQLES